MKSARRGGRQARTAKRADAEVKAFDPAWRRWRRPYKPIEQLSADEVEAIHQASLKVLRDTGIRVLSPEACTLYRGAGMTVSDKAVVTFDPDRLLELIALAPSEVTLHARGLDRDVLIGGAHVGVCTTGGTPNFSDLDAGRHPGPRSWACRR